MLTSELSQVSSFPYSWQGDLFLASDVTGLSWSSLVTVGCCEPGRVGSKSWVRLIAGGGVCVIIEVSPTVPLYRVTPIRCEMLSHITELDTASLCLPPTLCPSLSLLLSFSPLPCSLCSCELIGYFIQHRLHDSHLSFVGLEHRRQTELKINSEAILQYSVGAMILRKERCRYHSKQI